MNVLITISLLLALVFILLTVSRSLEWWERKAHKRSKETPHGAAWAALRAAETDARYANGGR